MHDTILQALGVIREIEQASRKHAELAQAMAGLYEDSRWLAPVPTKVESAVVVLLNTILGEDLAFYYLYENPKGGRLIIEQSGREWPLNTVEELAAYVEGRGQ